MSEMMNSMGPAGQSRPSYTASAARQTPPAVEVTAQAVPRPGLVTFAAVMMFFVGGFSAVWAIVEFSGPAWLHNVYSAYGYANMTDYSWLWGSLDLIVGAIAIYAGVSVLRGGAFAQIIGLAIAGFSAMRWFFFLPAAPWIAITIIVLDVLVVYGLVTHSEYFAKASFE